MFGVGHSESHADFGLTVDRFEARPESGDVSCGGFAGVCNDDPGSVKCRGVSGRPPDFEIQAVRDGSPGIGDGGRRVAREQRVPHLDERAFARRVEDEVPCRPRFFGAAVEIEWIDEYKGVGCNRSVDFCSAGRGNERPEHGASWQGSP